MFDQHQTPGILWWYMMYQGLKLCWGKRSGSGYWHSCRFIETSTLASFRLSNNKYTLWSQKPGDCI